MPTFTPNTLFDTLQDAPKVYVAVAAAGFAVGGTAMASSKAFC